MARGSTSAYDDDFSDDELKALEEHAGSDAVPPVEDDDAAPIAPETVAEELGLAPAEPAAPAAPVAETEEEAFQAFLKANEGKSPDELAKIAFQQSKRANAEAFRGRKSQEQIEAIRENAAKVLADRRADIAARRDAFNTKLAEDPDAATRDVHEALLSQEEQAAEYEAVRARQDAAIELASTAIPDFVAKAPAIQAFGQEMNYTREELNGITDGRDLVTLYLASLTGRLIKAGMMDVHGNFTQAPQVVADTPTDPRLRTPAPVKTLSSVPARSAGTTPNVEQQLSDLLNLSDADFNKLTDAQLENLLRQAG